MVRHEKSLVPGFFKVSVDHLSGNLESGKVNYCLGKKAGKSLEFWIQKSVRTVTIIGLLWFAM